MLALNSAKAPTNELAVREALNHAVNKKALIDNVLYGTQQVADTLFAPSVPYANIGLKPRQYDPQQAKALLEKAGWMLPAGKAIRYQRLVWNEGKQALTDYSRQWHNSPFTGADFEEDDPDDVACAVFEWYRKTTL